uniref:Karyopherin subunit alpha 5 n=1 Tax=Homo sapiens TaxID=9606 RepID=A0A8V8TL68_HUMAN
MGRQRSRGRGSRTFPLRTRRRGEFRFFQQVLWSDGQLVSSSPPRLTVSRCHG